MSQVSSSARKSQPSSRLLGIRNAALNKTTLLCRGGGSVGSLNILGKTIPVPTKLIRSRGTGGSMGHLSRVNTTPTTAPSPSPASTPTPTELDLVNHIGQLVCIAGVQTGTLRYYGTTHFQEGLWCGIELDSPVGKNNGTIGGKKYFNCPENFGIFAPISKVSLQITTLEVQGDQIRYQDQYLQNEQNEQMDLNPSMIPEELEDQVELPGLPGLPLPSSLRESGYCGGSDPMTDSDFNTESDAEGTAGEGEQDSHSNDGNSNEMDLLKNRNARVIDGALYTSNSKSAGHSHLSHSNFLNQSLLNSRSNASNSIKDSMIMSSASSTITSSASVSASEMESSGFYSDASGSGTSTSERNPSDGRGRRHLSSDFDSNSNSTSNSNGASTIQLQMQPLLSLTDLQRNEEPEIYLEDSLQDDLDNIDFEETLEGINYKMDSSTTSSISSNGTSPNALMARSIDSSEVKVEPATEPIIIVSEVLLKQKKQEPEAKEEIKESNLNKKKLSISSIPNSKSEPFGYSHILHPRKTISRRSQSVNCLASLSSKNCPFNVESLAKQVQQKSKNPLGNKPKPDSCGINTRVLPPDNSVFDKTFIRHSSHPSSLTRLNLNLNLTSNDTQKEILLSCDSDSIQAHHLTNGLNKENSKLFNCNSTTTQAKSSTSSNSGIFNVTRPSLNSTGSDSVFSGFTSSNKARATAADILSRGRNLLGGSTRSLASSGAGSLGGAAPSSPTITRRAPPNINQHPKKWEAVMSKIAENKHTKIDVSHVKSKVYNSFKTPQAPKISKNRLESSTNSNNAVILAVELDKEIPGGGGPSETSHGVHPFSSRSSTSSDFSNEDHPKRPTRIVPHNKPRIKKEASGGMKSAYHNRQLSDVSTGSEQSQSQSTSGGKGSASGAGATTTLLTTKTKNNTTNSNLSKRTTKNTNLVASSLSSTHSKGASTTTLNNILSNNQTNNNNNNNKASTTSKVQSVGSSTPTSSHKAGTNVKKKNSPVRNPTKGSTNQNKPSSSQGATSVVGTKGGAQIVGNANLKPLLKDRNRNAAASKSGPMSSSRACSEDNNPLPNSIALPPPPPTTQVFIENSSNRPNTITTSSSNHQPTITTNTSTSTNNNNLHGRKGSCTSSGRKNSSSSLQNGGDHSLHSASSAKEVSKVISEFEERLHTLSSDWNKERSEFRQRISSLETKAEALVIVIQQGVLQEGRLQQKLDEEIETVRIKTKLLGEKTKEIETLRTELDRERECQQEELAVHRNRQKQLETVVEDHSIYVSQLKKSHEDAIGQIKKSLSEEVEKLLEVHRLELEELKKKHKESLDAHKKQSPHDLLIKEVDSLQAVLEMRNDEIRNLNKDLIHYKSTLEEVHNAKETVRALQANREDLEAQMEKSRGDKAILQQKIQELQEDLTCTESEKARFSRLYEQISYKYQALERSTSSVEEDDHPYHHRSPRRANTSFGEGDPVFKEDGKREDSPLRNP